MPATPGSAATIRSVVVADLRYSAYPTRNESGIRPGPELMGASGFFVRGAGAGAGGAAGAGRPSGTGGPGGGAANGTTPGPCRSAGGTNAGAGVRPGRAVDGAPRMTMLRVIGADGTDGRFDDRPAGSLRGTAPPPPPRPALCGTAPLALDPGGAFGSAAERRHRRAGIRRRHADGAGRLPTGSFLGAGPRDGADRICRRRRRTGRSRSRGRSRGWRATARCPRTPGPATIAHAGKRTADCRATNPHPVHASPPTVSERQA